MYNKLLKVTTLLMVLFLPTFTLAGINTAKLDSTNVISSVTKHITTLKRTASGHHQYSATYPKWDKLLKAPINNYIEQTFKRLAKEAVNKDTYVDSYKKIGSTYVLISVVPSIMPNKMAEYFPTLYSNKMFPYLQNSGYGSGGLNFAHLIIGYDNNSGDINVHMFFAVDKNEPAIIIWPQDLMTSGEKSAAGL